ncbi:MAG: hypothetical protein J6S57_02945, partial [Alphaproteobacteria bacterium]|nr:hypothetical protein [Alphaproteobacteria bacterium]
QNTPDWTILENPRQDYGITQEEFCKHLYVSRGDDIGGSIVLANYSDDPNMLNAAIQHGAGHGYQCRQLGGMWIVTQETYGRYWKCKIKKSKCTPMMLEE